MVELGLHELHSPEASIVEQGGCNSRWKNIVTSIDLSAIRLRSCIVEEPIDKELNHPPNPANAAIEAYANPPTQAFLCRNSTQTPLHSLMSSIPSGFKPTRKASLK